ncbi:molybdopterin cofactor-binding domain-containing protein [Streptomyces sp. NPDC050211]|uniref:xanthine dehydrogenase family protein molybdopterin-binding subunit n=1 Tax=Streptomyces sp. NPDC050211 TaxID=3154932 RepID=UPI00343AEB2D
MVTLDVPPGTIMRAPGEEASSFALECAMDELAYELGIDPVELRRTNNADRHPTNGRPYSSKHLDECMSVGARRFGWSRRAPEPRSAVDGEWLVGRGMAVGVFRAMRYGISAHVAFRRDGTVAVEAATSDPGTGMKTVVAITAADRLGIPVGRVDSEVGDNTLRSKSPDGWGVAAGSAGTASVAPAVRAASEAATDALIKHAVEHRCSPFHGLDPEEVRYRDGRLSADGRGVDFGRLLAMTRTRAVGAERSSGPTEEMARYALSTFAAHFCEVRVHRFTGEPRVARMTTVVDGGTILNSGAARNQIVGGVVFGLGQALLEGAEVERATGRIANASPPPAGSPTRTSPTIWCLNADVPDIDVRFLDHPDTVISPVGSRGVGEIGTTGSGAAIANAVFNATGKRIRDLPITPDKLIG